MSKCEHGKAYDEYCYTCAARGMAKQRQSETFAEMLRRATGWNVTEESEEGRK